MKYLIYFLILPAIVEEMRAERPYMKIDKTKTVRFQNVERKKYSPKGEDDELELIDVAMMQPYCSNHILESQGNGFCGAFKYVYNAYKDNYVEKQTTPSVYVRCVMCLAIAKQLENHIEEFSEDKTTTPLPHNSNILKVDSYISGAFCSRAFSDHEMRNCNGVLYIGKVSDCGKTYSSNYDGQWTNMLTEMCKGFINQITPESKYNLYSGHRDKSLHLDEFLCQGYGVFRECGNLRRELESHQNCKDEYADCPFWCRYI